MIIFSIRQAQDGALYFVVTSTQRHEFKAWHRVQHKERDGECPCLTIVDLVDTSCASRPFAREMYIACGHTIFMLDVAFTGGHVGIQPAQGAWETHVVAYDYPLEADGSFAPA